jgi:hypothetical protein
MTLHPKFLFFLSIKKGKNPNIFFTIFLIIKPLKNQQEQSYFEGKNGRILKNHFYGV